MAIFVGTRQNSYHYLQQVSGKCQLNTYLYNIILQNFKKNSLVFLAYNVKLIERAPSIFVLFKFT